MTLIDINATRPSPKESGELELTDITERALLLAVIIVSVIWPLHMSISRTSGCVAGGVVVAHTSSDDKNDNENVALWMMPYHTLPFPPARRLSVYWLPL